MTERTGQQPEGGVTRRELLAKGGRVAAGAALTTQLGWLVAACGDGGPSSNALSALQSDLTGSLLLPDDPGFPTVNSAWNLEFSDIQPVGIARVANAEDVQTCIGWARDNGVDAVARSGGHSYAGYSSTTGLLVDLGDMSSIEVDPGSGQVALGAGAGLGAVDSAVAPFLVTVPAGRCPTVGVAGLTLGGGFGFSARKFGLTSDSLLETNMVTADGELIRVAPDENTDLWWALQGGGGGNFGINTDFTFQGQDVSSNVSIYQIAWAGYDQAREVWSTMQEIALDAPEDDFSMELGIFASGPASDEAPQSLSTLGQYFGPRSELEEILAPVLNSTTPTTSTIQEFTFADATDQLKATISPDAFLSKSNYLTSGIPGDGIDLLVEEMKKFPQDARAGEFKIFTWGGKISDVAADATAFVHRNAAFVNEGSSSWLPDASQSIIDQSKSWINDMYARLDAHLEDRSYQNFIDPTLEDWQSAYYGENFDRLVEIKTEVDPDGFFNFDQGIPTA